MTTGTIAALVAAGALVALVGPKLRARLILSRAKHRSLAGHSRLSRRIAALLPRYAYDDAAFFAADDAGAAIADRRRAAFERLSGEMRSAGVRTVERTAEATPFISDLQFTESYRVPFQFSPRVQRQLPAGSFVESSDGVQVTDLDGTARYDLTGSYGVNLLGYDFYKGCMERGAAAGRRARAGARRLSVAGRRQCRAAGADLGQGRGLLPHVGHGGGHAGRPAGALSHEALASRALLRRLSRLVGRRAARHRQSRAGARHLHPGRHVRAHPGRAAHPPQHRLRAGQSVPGDASQPRGARRFDPGPQPAGQERRSRRLFGVAEGAAGDLHRARHRADLRRGLRRLPPRARRGAGIFRRPGRHRDLRQDGRRRLPDRRGLRRAPAG